MEANEKAPAWAGLLTVKQFAERYPAWTQPSLRNLIFHAADRYSASGEVVPGNRLLEMGALVRVGRRVLLDDHAFHCRWIPSMAEAGRGSLAAARSGK